MRTIIKGVVALCAAATVSQVTPTHEATSVQDKQDKKVVKLDATKLDAIAAGKIEPVKVNGGGNTPNGNANGVPTQNQNPAGHAPPGQNP